MTPRLCAVPNCGRPVVARGFYLCEPHQADRDAHLRELHDRETR